MRAGAFKIEGYACHPNLLASTEPPCKIVAAAKAAQAANTKTDSGSGTHCCMSSNMPKCGDRSHSIDQYRSTRVHTDTQTQTPRPLQCYQQ